MLDNKHYFFSNFCFNGMAISESELDDKGLLEGTGSILFSNGNYFEGEFYGSIRDRSGTLTLSKDGCVKTIGKWCNGLKEVNIYLNCLKCLSSNKESEPT